MREDNHNYRVELKMGEIDVTSIVIEVEPHAITVAFRDFAHPDGRTHRRSVFLDTPVERNRSTVAISAGQILITAAKKMNWTVECWHEYLSFNTRASVGSV